MMLSCHGNVGLNYETKMVYMCFESVAHLKCLGMTVTDQYFICLQT
jgi:hypothetical protein